MRKLAVEGVLLETADAGFKLASKFLFDDEKAEVRKMPSRQFNRH